MSCGRVLTADEHHVLRRDVRRRHFGGISGSILVQAEIATTARASGPHPTVELAVTLPQSENGDGKLHVAGEQRVMAPNVNGPERPGPRARVPAHVQRQGGGQQRVQHPIARVHGTAAGRNRGAEQLVHHGRVFGVHAGVLLAVRGRAPVNRRGRDEQQTHVRVPDHVDLKRAALVLPVRGQPFGHQYRAQVRVRRINGHCVHDR